MKILNWNDRDTFILEIWWKKIWILTFKNILQKEDSTIKSKNWYVEIKSFFLFDGFWKGYIWFLWEKLIKEIKEKFWNTDWLYVTISKTKAYSSLNMFKKIWFKELYDVHNEYSEDNSLETHLYMPLNIENKNSNLSISLKNKYLKQIKDWTKKVEWRSWKSYFNYKLWDNITFYNKSWKITKTIKGIIRYWNLEDYLKQEWIDNVLPWVKSIENAIEIYNNIPWYKEKIKKFWIIAFRF